MYVQHHYYSATSYHLFHLVLIAPYHPAHMRLKPCAMVCVAQHVHRHHIHSSIVHVPLRVGRHTMHVQRHSCSATSYHQRHLNCSHLHNARYHHAYYFGMQVIMRHWMTHVYTLPFAMSLQTPHTHSYIRVLYHALCLLASLMFGIQVPLLRPNLQESPPSAMNCFENKAMKFPSRFFPSRSNIFTL